MENKAYAAWMVSLFDEQIDQMVGDILDGFLSGGYLTMRQDSLKIAIQERDLWLSKM